MSGPPVPTGHAARLTVYLGARDRSHHRLLTVELVHVARRMGMAGATIFRAHAGYGHSGHMHSTHLLREDAPETFVVVDRPDRVEALALAVRRLAADALLLVEDVEVVGT